MRKIVSCSVLAFLMVIAIRAQNKSVNKTATKPTQKTTIASLQLKTLEDSANYVIGISVVNFYRQQGVTNINSAIVTRAINDLIVGDKLLLDEVKAYNAMTTYLNKKNSPVSKTIVKPVQKNTTALLQLKTLEDSANYGMGLNAAYFYRQQGVARINSVIVKKACNDALTGKQLLLNDIQANNVMMTFLNGQQALKSKPNIDAGQNFLTENKKKQGVITTGSGLQYEVITQGTGPKPLINDTVVCNYKGTFLNGTEFDNSYSRGAPAEFGLTGVIKGWTEVLQLMPAGSKYKVYVPHYLGYGSGDYNGIPGGSLLIFEIELLRVKGK